MASPKKKQAQAAPAGDITSGGITNTGLVRHPIRLVPLAMLKRAEFNPRRISQHAKTGLANAIERFGLVQQIVWNERSGNVVGGHQRLDVLEERGETDAEVIVVDLDEQEERLLNVTLNNPDIQGTWDDEKLGELLSSLRESDTDDMLSELAQDLRLDNLFASFAEDPELPEPPGGGGTGPATPPADDTPPPAAPAIKTVTLYIESKDSVAWEAAVNAWTKKLGAESMSDAVVQGLIQSAPR